MYAGKHRDVETPVLQSVLDSNQKHVAKGIEMVERSGKKRIGVLGLSFKAGTDDVRESPVVPLVETLVGRGYQVCVFDETLIPANLVGSNKAFLDGELPHIEQLMRNSVEDVIAEAEVVVVTNGSKSFRDVLDKVNGEQKVIDLFGLANSNGCVAGKYEGICW
jgi:GDP-mannose 6-dehydrogenase